MKTICMLVLAGGLAVLSGCSPEGSAAQDGGSFIAPPARGSASMPAVQSREVARLSGQPITLDQLEKPLIEGYGLTMLLNIVQVEYVKQMAAHANIVVTPQDIATEREQTLAKRFTDADKAEYETLLSQFLEQTNTSRVEFDMALETNTYLRKLAEPSVKDQISDATLQEAFRQLYGETIQVRHIQLTNMTEVLEAKRRLAAGEPFEKVAAELSRNARTAELGGELPPFSRQAQNIPQAFKDAAFALKEGEVSDAVQAEGAFHLIKVEKRIPPKAVKFEDVKESLREDLHERLVQAQIRGLKVQVASEAIKALIIDDPVIQKQFDDRLHKKDQQITDRNQIREQLERERQRILEAATQPAATTAPANPPAPEVARPPATMGTR